MNKFFCTLLAVTFLLASVTPLHAAPEMKQRVEYYDIQGSTKEELRQEMSRKSQHGSGHYGYTSWTLDWGMGKMNPLPDGGCRVDSVYVTGEIVVYLPRWKGANAWTPLGREWNRFSKALAKHEEGHRKIDLDLAYEMERKLAETVKAHAKEDCRRLDTAVRVVGYGVMSEIDRQNIKYDQETQSGKTQGATL